MTERICMEEGLRLFQFAPLEELQERAQQIRQQKHPHNYVTFVLDSNPNYTNICDVDCTFCAFYRTKNAPDAYFETPEQAMRHMDFAQKAGIKTVLLQGGVHPEVSIDYLAEIVRLARTRYPDIHPHFFSAIEIWNAAKVSQISVQTALETLWDAGLRTIPGGGAEILSERIRKRISPKKIGPGGWLDLHTKAHQIGFKTTATMMYGHVEDANDILEHLEAIRSAQDVCPGFNSFIPWSYKKTNTALRRVVKRWAGAEAYFRILAFARIYLDNFDHIAASWFSEGKEIGIQALQYGADDFGGTILEENVHRATEFINKADHNDMLRMIRAAGYEPAQRDSFYTTIKTYDDIKSVLIPQEGKVKEQDSIKLE